MVRAIVKVALPTSILSIEHSLLQKSIRIHQVARWTSIFGVREVIFFKERSTSSEEFSEHRYIIEEHWRYFFTPPYLRKLLVPLSPVLRHVGVLPPIRLNIFDVDQKPREGEERLAYVFKDENGLLRAHVGDVKPYLVKGPCEKTGEIVLVKVVSAREKVVECLDKEVYRGPALSFVESLKKTLDIHGKRANYVVVTDRKGNIPRIDDVKKMQEKSILVLFGGPKYDLFELAEQESFNIMDYADFVWNTIPEQKVVTVRTEEALVITLGILNVFLAT
ncbi:MAG: putative RNA uridine N3 methyltransferase [Desulfurococcaceae archaeon]|jgi:predicted SPOUT superfamily RNA methylase MTH1